MVCAGCSAGAWVASHGHCINVMLVGPHTLCNGLARLRVDRHTVCDHVHQDWPLTPFPVASSDSIQAAAGIPTAEAAARAEAAAAAAVEASSTPHPQPSAQSAAARAAAVLRGRLAVALEITRSASLRDLAREDEVERGAGSEGWEQEAPDGAGGSAAGAASAAGEARPHHERVPSFAWSPHGRRSGDGSRSFTFDASPAKAFPASGPHPEAGGRDADEAHAGSDSGARDEEGGALDGHGDSAGASDARGTADQVSPRGSGGGGAGTESRAGGGGGRKRVAARNAAASRLRAASGGPGDEGQPAWQLAGHRWERTPPRRTAGE